MLFLLMFLCFSHFFIHASPVPILSTDGAFDACTCPDRRTVWDILWSCLATIFACSWVSVHPNIQEPKEAWWLVILRRLELMFWSIFSPELIVYWAMRQWDGARRLKRKYRRTSFPNLQWTMTHGHFIQMGGFMLFDGQVARGTLSPERFEELLGDGKIEFPTITKEEIQDRSKGDALSKGLVIGQTTWFIIECIARKAQGLDTTQIELLTLALNGVIYFLWWDKPLDVRCPVPVHMLETPIDPIKPDTCPKTSATTCLKNDWIQFHDTVRSIGSWLRYIASRPLKAFEGKPWFIVPFIILFHWPKSAFFVLLRRLRDFRVSDRRRSVEYERMRVPSLYALARDQGGGLRKIDITSAVLGILFGAIHCVGWFYTFPTHVEAHLWRVCSVLVTTIPALFTVLVSLERVFRLHESIEDFFDWFLECYIALLIATLPVYILARLCLLVEAIISLRALPPKAYTNVEWTLFLPHI
ncbi:hypothetical protein BU17DRAFT_56524 [Hysterangium stoloniferum]|nr:hypothetical protein BU17DRAFT_56524 [Hysterangium stoloniferum]